MNIKKNLSPEDKRRLLILLQERKSRNLPNPKVETVNLVDDWGVDENGYFVRDDGWHYNPSDTHLKAITCTSRYFGLWGRRGCGKTGLGSQLALRKIKEGKSGSVINPDMENFKISTWPELKRWIPWHMVVPRQRYRQSLAWEPTRPFVIAFVNGAIMYCKGLKDPDSARGPNLNWLWYDEGGRDKTGLGWRLAIAGVRIGEEPQAWTTYTPKSFDHWTYEFFVKKEISQELKDLLVKLHWPISQELISSFHCSIKDNEDNLDPFFRASLMAAYPSGYLRMNELEGEYANEEGALGDRKWFDGHALDIAPTEGNWVGKKTIRFWDLAGSEKKVGADPDETVGSKLSCDTKKENFCIEAQIGGFWLWDKVKENIKNVAMQDGPQIPIYIEQEPGSGGKNQVAELASLLKPLGFTVRAHNPRDDGDRVMAANTWFGEAAQGFWWIVKGLWNEKFYAQLDVFPDPDAHDDRITSVSGGRHSIAPVRKWRKVKFLHFGTTTEKKPELGITSLHKPVEQEKS
jgi:predicted phage terminase large subunit-like protein